MWQSAKRRMKGKVLFWENRQRMSRLTHIILFGLGSVLPVGGSIAGHDIDQPRARAPQVNSSAEPLNDENERKHPYCIESNAPFAEKLAATGSRDRSPAVRRCLCRPVIPANESLPDKLIRIFFGPDWCGPDPDVDTNISAGGAAGG